MAGTGPPRPDEGTKWGLAATEYSRLVTDVTVKAARDLVSEAFSSRSVSSSNNILDVGCGSGNVVIVLHEQDKNAPILATDISPGMLEVVDAKGYSNVRTEVADACHLKNSWRNAFTHVFSTFAIQFAPDPVGAVREMYRVLQPSGVVGIGTWGSSDVIELFRQAGKSLDPTFDGSKIFSPGWPENDEKEAEGILKNIGFVDIHVRTFGMVAELENEMIVDYMLGGTNPAAELLVAPFRETGRFEELRAAAFKILDDSWTRLGKKLIFRALLVNARKP